MVLEIEKLLTRIKELRRELTELWEERQTTDQEILALSVKLDTLLNEYQRLILSDETNK